MTDPRPKPARTTLVAGGLVALGIILAMTLSMGFLIVSAVGAFGPGLLRELGWLDDLDEFQRQASYRAGYLAYLIGGATAVAAIAVLKWREANLDGAATWVALVLAVMWLAWLFSSLLAFWGARRTTGRVLIAFGSFWAFFVLASHWREPVAALIEAVAFVAPFFVLAWAANRWPRAAGLLLIALPAFMLWQGFGDFLQSPEQSLTFVLLLVPMLACGFALLREGPGTDEH